MENNLNQYGIPYRRTAYYSAKGVIVEIEPTRMGNRREDGCKLFISIEDENGSIINFIVTPSTYVIDFATLREGMECTFFYRADTPVPLIYPPQYNAAVVDVSGRKGKFVTVGYFNSSLVNEDQTLQIKMDSRVSILTTNNQTFLGSPANHNLVVIYDTTTRSIPAQTTPMKIIVLCD